MKVSPHPLSKIGRICTFSILFPKIVFALSIPQHSPVVEENKVEPQIQWSGIGIGTLKPQWYNSSSPATTIDFTDTALVFSASQALYGNGDRSAIGSFVFGSLMTDQSLTGTGLPLFIHQAYVSIQSSWFEAYIGRSENPVSQIIDLPTIRPDDFIAFTAYLNPFSNSAIVQEYRYSNIASITLNHQLNYFANLHVQHFIQTLNNLGLNDNGTEIDSYGLTLEFLNSYPMMESLSQIQILGLGYERVPLKNISSNTQNVIYGGGVVNLNKSIIHHFELRFQDVLTLGNSLNTFQNLSDTVAADSNVASVGLQYLHRPFGVPGYQIAFTTGFRNYFGINQSNSWGIALTGAQQLGSGFNLVSQLIYQWRASALAAQYDQKSQIYSFELGLVYRFEAGTDVYLTPRRTLLNTKYGNIVN